MKIGDRSKFKGKGSQLRLDSNEESFIRSWLSLYEYEEIFDEPVPKANTDYRKEKGTCKWCGDKLVGRRRSFCCDDHSIDYSGLTVWGRRQAALPYKIACRDRFYCRVTGEDLAKTNKFGMRLPCSNGSLAIHHLIFVSKGGTDHESNLITVSKEVHKLYHQGDPIIVELVHKLLEEQWTEKMLVDF